MSEITPGDEQIIADAQADYQAYLKGFEGRFGYGIAVAAEPSIGPDRILRVDPVMKLIKLPPITTVAQPANPATEPQNADTTTKEASPSDSSEQPNTEAAQ